MSDQITQTQALLGQIPALAAELPQYLSGCTPATDSSESKRFPPGSKPPIDVGLLDLILGRDLEWWTRLAYETMTDIHEAASWQSRKAWLDEHPGPAQPWTLASECEWLAQHTEWIIDQFPEPEPVATDTICYLYCGYGHELTAKTVRVKQKKLFCSLCPERGFAADIRRLHNDYQRAARIPREITYRCDRCGWAVESHDNNSWFGCTGCDKTWSLAGEIGKLMENQASVMTLGQIADRTGISHPTLRRWKAQGRITPVGAKHGRPLYDIRHIRQAAERTKETA